MIKKHESKNKKHILKRLLLSSRCKICAEVIPIEKDFCNKCSLEKIRIAEDKISSLILTNKSFDAITSPFYYDEPINKCIRNLKYNNFKAAGNFLAEEIADVIERDFSDENPDFVTCIPLSKSRKREKIFNHGEIIAKDISKVFDIAFAPDLLIKTKNTKSQVTLSADERKTNLKNAFRVNRKYNIKDKTILICDDVMTTGSTLEECSKTLKKAGAKRVICSVAALNSKDL